MDPFTIVQTVSAVGELTVICMRACQKLYEFAGEVKTIDRTLGRVEDEVQDLDRTLRMVAAGLNDHSVKRAARSRVGQDILVVVHTSVDRAKYVLEKLKSVLEIITGEPNDTSSVRALRQAVRSKRQQKELNECLAQVAKSKQSLNLGLTTLSVHIVASLPQYRHSGAEEEIAPLTKQLESVLQSPKNVEDFRIRRTAASVLERAKSPPPPGESISRSTTLLAEEPVEDAEPSDDSESDDAQAPVKKWMHLLESSKTSKLPSRRASVSKPLKSYDSFDSEPDLDGTPLLEPANEKFQIKLVRSAIERGHGNYEAKNYEQASAQLEEALRTAASLTKQARTFLERDLIQVRLNIASMYTAQEKYLDAAEEHLLKAVVDINDDRRGNDDEMQGQLYSAFHNLARVYFLERKYNEAQAYCEDALNGQLDSCGDQSKPYFDALQMLIQIYSAQGNNVRAQLCLDELPVELRDKAREKVQAGVASPSLGHGFPPAPQLSAPPKQRNSVVNGFLSNRLRTTSIGISPLQTVSTDMSREDSADTTRQLAPDLGIECPPDQGMELLRELAQAGFSGDFDADRALAWAIKEDKERVVHGLISGPGIPIMRKRAFGGSPKQVFKLASINGSTKRDMRDSQPLMLATTTPGRVMIAKTLLGRGAHKNIKDDRGRSLLEVAAMHGQQEIISVLLEEGGPGATLHSAEGLRAFHLAAQQGRINVLGLFLQRGVKPDLTDVEYAYGRTAVNFAAQRGHEAAVDFLIQHGADPNIADRGGSTPLMASVRERHEGTTRILLRLFADVNMANDRGQTALIIAAEQGHHVAARLLLDESSILVDVKDNSGWTALTWAVNRRHINIVQMILEHGQANVNAQCARGSRPYDHARGWRPMLDLLRQHGAQRGTGLVQRGGVTNNEFQGYVLI